MKNRMKQENREDRPGLQAEDKRHTTRKQFTLVELLVIVAIIGILASILLPTLSKARETAYRVECANNLFSIGKTFTMHMVANNGKMPTYDWMLEEEMRDAYECPKDDAPKVMDFISNEGKVIADVKYSYGFNLSCGDTNILNVDDPSSFTTSFDAGDLYDYYREVELKDNSGHGNNEDGYDSDNTGNKSGTDLSGEIDDEIKAGSSYGSAKWAADIGGVAPTDTDSWYYQNLYFRHLDTACHLFLDGSVKIEYSALNLSMLLVDVSTDTGAAATPNGNGN